MLKGTKGELLKKMSAAIRLPDEYADVVETHAQAEEVTAEQVEQTLRGVGFAT